MSEFTDFVGLRGSPPGRTPTLFLSRCVSLPCFCLNWTNFLWVLSQRCAVSLIIHFVPVLYLKKFFSSLRNAFFNGGKNQGNLVSSLWPLVDEQLGVLVLPQATWVQYLRTELSHRSQLTLSKNIWCWNPGFQGKLQVSPDCWLETSDSLSPMRTCLLSLSASKTHRFPSRSAQWRSASSVFICPLSLCLLFSLNHNPQRVLSPAVLPHQHCEPCAGTRHWHHQQISPCYTSHFIS